MSTLILASQSPRRRELLASLGVEFSVVVADIDETPVAGEAPTDCVARLAQGKVEAVWQRLVGDHSEGAAQNPVVLGSDTLVVIDQQILGKPRDRADAAQMLAQLSGREHQVLTAVAMRDAKRQKCIVQTSAVSFAKLSKQEIQRYIATGEPDDKAGSYAIQGQAAAFVVSLNGSFSGVVGLPLYETRQLLLDFGIQTAL